MTVLEAAIWPGLCISTQSHDKFYRTPGQSPSVQSDVIIILVHVEATLRYYRHQLFAQCKYTQDD